MEMLYDIRVFHHKRTCNVYCRCKSRDELITVHGTYRAVARIHSYEFGAFESQQTMYVRSSYAFAIETCVFHTD